MWSSYSYDAFDYLICASFGESNKSQPLLSSVHMNINHYPEVDNWAQHPHRDPRHRPVMMIDWWTIYIASRSSILCQCHWLSTHRPAAVQASTSGSVTLPCTSLLTLTADSELFKKYLGSLLKPIRSQHHRRRQTHLIINGIAWQTPRFTTKIKKDSNSINSEQSIPRTMNCLYSNSYTSS